MSERERAKRLIDQLSEEELPRAIDFLESVRDLTDSPFRVDEPEEDVGPAPDGDGTPAKPKKRETLSFKLTSKRQTKSGEKVRRWEWGF